MSLLQTTILSKSTKTIKKDLNLPPILRSMPAPLRGMVVVCLRGGVVVFLRGGVVVGGTHPGVVVPGGPGVGILVGIVVVGGRVVVRMGVVVVGRPVVVTIEGRVVVGGRVVGLGLRLRHDFHRPR